MQDITNNLEQPSIATTKSQSTPIINSTTNGSLLSLVLPDIANSKPSQFIQKKPQSKTIKSQAETFSVKKEEFNSWQEQQVKKPVVITLTDAAIELSPRINQSIQENGIAREVNQQKSVEPVDLSDSFIGNLLSAEPTRNENILPETKTKQEQQNPLDRNLPTEPNNQRKISAKKVVDTDNNFESNAAQARKNPVTLRAFMQSIGDWIAKTFGLSQQKVQADLAKETDQLTNQPESFVKAKTDQEAERRFKIWLPQFVRKMLNSSKNSQPANPLNSNNQQSVLVQQ